MAPTGGVPTGLEPRHRAWRVLRAVAAGAYADRALERELTAARLEPRDRALATELAYGAIRQRRLLDGWITALARVPAERQPPSLRWLLHVGLVQLLFSQRVPASAAVSTSVELARRIGLERLAPAVNGILRGVLRRRDALPTPLSPWDGLVLPEDPVESLGLRHSLPPWLAAELLHWLPAEGAEAFGRAVNATPSLDLRVNTCRRQLSEQVADFAAAGLEALPVAGAPLALTLPGRGGHPRDLPGFQEGHWCVQDRHAQAVVPLLDPRPGERILDACAAPGGKTTQIAEAVANQAEVWAVDRCPDRLQRVVANAERLGHSCLHTLAADASELAERQPTWRGSFQRILLDAPCSGLGTLGRHADARWRVDGQSLEEMVALQNRLLEGLAPLLAPAGRLVYATCTVHPRENQERIRAFLALHPTWTLRQERQWWPAAEGGDGFYAAVLEAPAGEGLNGVPPAGAAGAAVD
jgi:16S rRNA (cytosine967-C5)-methyltransferase